MSDGTGGFRVRNSSANRLIDARFELPPRFVVAERRMAGQAIDQWRATGNALVTGFDAHSLIIADPAGMATIEAVGSAIAAVFGLGPGMRLDGRDGLAAEARAACDLIAIRPQPVPFELSMTTPSAALILARGVALPIGNGRTMADQGQLPDRVQIIINWREVLDRAATTRLRSELGAALRLVSPVLAKNDPFSIKMDA